MGVFEFDGFDGGTKALAEAIAASPAFSIAGGGDTIAAINKFGVADRIGYISTALAALPRISSKRQNAAGGRDTGKRAAG